MHLLTEPVSSFLCEHCGCGISTTGLTPLSACDCPACGKRVHAPAMFGSLVLLEVLGEGSAGMVCRALDMRLQRQVAVKIFKADTDPVAPKDRKIRRQRAMTTIREARLLATIDHPNVVHIFSVGEYRSQLFIQMELLQYGGMLRLLEEGKTLPPTEAMELAIDIASGLAAAHKAGLIHGDIKPANLLLDENRRAKLIDFGTAAATLGTPADEQTGLNGTPWYAAPEVVQGQTPDFRSDMYSLGATLFHLMTGRPPFKGDSPVAVATARLHRPAPSLASYLPDAPPDIARVIATLLQMNPADRYADYSQLLADVQVALEALGHKPRSAALLTSALSGTREINPEKLLRATVGNNARAAACSAPTNWLPATVVSIGGVIALAVIGYFLVLGSTGKPKSNTPGDTTARRPPATTPVNNRPRVDASGGPGSTVQFPDDADQPRPDIFEAAKTQWIPLTVVELSSRDGASFHRLSDGSILVSGNNPGMDVYKVVLNTPLPTLTAVRLEVLRHSTLPNGGPGREKDGKFRLSHLKVIAQGRHDGSFPEPVNFLAAFDNTGRQDRSVSNLLTDESDAGWGFTPSTRSYAYNAVFMMAKPVSNSSGTRLTVTLDHRYQKERNIGRFRIWATAADHPETVEFKDVDLSTFQQIPTDLKPATGAGPAPEPPATPPVAPHPQDITQDKPGPAAAPVTPTIPAPSKPQTPAKPVPAAEPEPVDDGKTFEIFVNGWKETHIDSTGNLWQNSSVYRKGGHGYVGGRFFSRFDEVKDPLLGSCITELTAYRVTVPKPGKYEVTLQFCELSKVIAGHRVFSVAIEGQDKIKSLDLVSQVGFGKPYSKTFTVEVTDKVLDIEFSGKSPVLNALNVKLVH